MSDKSSSLHVGIVGNGPQRHTLLQWFADGTYRSVFPDSTLTGIVAGEISPDPGLVRELDPYMAKDLPDLLQSRPKTDLLLVAEDDPAFLAALRMDVPSRVSILDSRGISVLEYSVSREKFCSTCRGDLSTVRSMLRVVLDEVTDDVLFLDSNRNILDVNINVCKRVDRPREYFLGKPSWSGWDRKTVAWEDKEPDPFEQALQTGGKSEGIHIRIDAKGKLYYYRVYVYPILDERSNMVFFLEMRRDISKRTYMEKQLQQSEKMAALGELAAYIAHEIRNPLVSIGGFAGSLLKNEELPGAVHNKVRIILDESKRLDTILRGILNFARPTPQESSVVDVNRIVEETMQVMGMGCEKQGVHLKMDLIRELPSVHGRGEAVKQSLINVVKNGIESMDRGGELVVSTRDADGFVRIEVTDTGTGIDKEHLENIFSPFFSTKESGSGLGLAMTKKVIEEMGGSVEVSSKKGQGTTVALLLKKNDAGE